MNLTRVSPFRDLQEFENAFGRFFSNLTPRLAEGEEDTARSNWAPVVDVTETDGELVFTFEVPGFQKDEVEISVNNGVLTVSGERKFEEQEGRNYRRVERWYGRFFRSFRIPTAIDADSISATLKDGLLVLTLPKREDAKPRQIPVSVQ